MPNYGTIAICPYFFSEDATAIKCLPIVELNWADTVHQIRFKNSDMKKLHLKCYCETHKYHLCPYASLMEQFWDDAGKPVRTIVKQHHMIREPLHRKKSKDINGQLSLRF